MFIFTYKHTYIYIVTNEYLACGQLGSRAKYLGVFGRPFFFKIQKANAKYRVQNLKIHPWAHANYFVLNSQNGVSQILRSKVLSMRVTWTL